MKQKDTVILSHFLPKLTK